MIECIFCGLDINDRQDGCFVIDSAARRKAAGLSELDIAVCIWCIHVLSRQAANWADGEREYRSWQRAAS